MKIINRKRSLKLAGLLLALLISLTVLEAGVKFARAYKYVGFEKKDGSWVQIAESAQVDNQQCQADLAQAKEDKQAAILSANPDLK